MSWLSEVEAEIREIVSLTWPEVGGQVYDSVQAARQNLLQSVTVAEADGGVGLPLAIVQMGKATRDDARGMHNRSFRVPTTILYLQRVSDTSVFEAQARMEAIQVAIERVPHATFQAIEDGEVDGRETSAALAALDGARMNLHAVVVVYRPGLLAGEFGG